MGAPLAALSRIAAGVATTQPRMNLLWATVATVDPLTVVLDHDPDETPRPAINAVGALRVGQRVTVSKTDQLLTVTGPVAGELTGGNSDGNWKFPARFVHPPTVVPGRYQLGSGKSWPTSPDDATTDHVYLCGLDVADRPRGFPLHITAYAIGYWR